MATRRPAPFGRNGGRAGALLALGLLAGCGITPASQASQSADTSLAQPHQGDANGAETVLPAALILPATVGTLCAESWQCEQFGHCTDAAGACVATTREGCERSLACKVEGWCSVINGRCLAAADADCQLAKVCKQEQACIAGHTGHCYGATLAPGELPRTFEVFDNWPEAPAPTYVWPMQALFAHYCGHCHTGTEPGACKGGTCLATFYEDAIKPSHIPECGQVSGAECGLLRVLQASDPESATGLAIGKDYMLLPEPHRELLARWIDQGMPER